MKLSKDRASANVDGRLHVKLLRLYLVSPAYQVWLCLKYLVRASSDPRGGVVSEHNQSLQ